MADNNNIPNDPGKLLTSWDFPEFQKYTRSIIWYLIMGLILIGLIAFAISTQGYLFLGIILLYVFIYYLRAKRTPLHLQIQIFEDGIQISDNTFYEWKDIKQFWIIYEPPEVKNLYLEFKTGFKPSITISLENQNPIQVRKILLQYLMEDTEKENESFSDGFSRLLKL
ncbi:MAG: hypothetical protein U9N54_01605 [candidate division Zixibacteria bacterium]|nr:hypothetical protein [candidate division Zixibacteria bacterium]